MPLHVVQANATMSKPSCCNSGSSLASSKYSCTALEPGASDVFTHGLRLKPRAFALRASSPAAITLRGLLVFVHDVIAAIITAPSGILPGTSSHLPAMPRSAKADVGKRLCGLEGPAMLRPTDDRSNFSTRSYCAVVNASAHKPVCFA